MAVASDIDGDDILFRACGGGAAAAGNGEGGSTKEEADILCIHTLIVGRSRAGHEDSYLPIVRCGRCNSNVNE